MTSCYSFFNDRKFTKARECIVRALQRCKKSPTVEATLKMFRDSYNPHCPGGNDGSDVTRKYMLFFANLDLLALVQSIWGEEWIKRYLKQELIDRGVILNLHQCYFSAGHISLLQIVPGLASRNKKFSTIHRWLLKIFNNNNNNNFVLLLRLFTRLQ